jgi:hypothetical protein
MKMETWRYKGREKTNKIFLCCILTKIGEKSGCWGSERWDKRGQQEIKKGRQNKEKDEIKTDTHRQDKN